MPAAPGSEAFAARLQRALNDAALCLMLSVGHRTGLLDAMRELPPATSAEIAAAAGLDERYVREWLGAMVTGGVVVLDGMTDRFRLPPEHAAFVTRAAGADNMAVITQYMAVLGGVEDDIVRCFRTGGGVPYERFPRFHEVVAEDSTLAVLTMLESAVLPLVPGLADRLARGLRALDVGCGRGRIAIRLAELFPRSRFTGIDLSTEAIAAARAEATDRALTNVEFIAADATGLGTLTRPASFDLLTTFDAVHDQAHPLQVLRGIRHALAPDGVYLMQDIRAASRMSDNRDHPLGTLLYTISCMHCMTVSLAQGGEGLGAMWGEQTTREYLQRAGFGSIEVHRLAHDLMNNWYVVRP